MRRVPVRSGAVSAVGYDPTTNELDIEYTGGDVYRYSMVPPSVHRELLAADSIGSFVNREVKPHYPGREIFDLG
ncbi:KTSC domain-containing protein [Pseudactinotalea suaedae]|uniref:KTSC domain-containing protein n=1 Tax=Pseudactinotalea suaedae TaxID=1524924 RepID=UPI0012E32593|nr:KTSC domain-containing protein [Pseudactinotalea suaedae]